MTSLQQSLVNAVRLGPCGRVFGWLRGMVEHLDSSQDTQAYSGAITPVFRPPLVGAAPWLQVPHPDLRRHSLA